MRLCAGRERRDARCLVELVEGTAEMEDAVLKPLVLAPEGRHLLGRGACRASTSREGNRRAADGRELSLEVVTLLLDGGEGRAVVLEGSAHLGELGNKFLGVNRHV